MNIKNIIKTALFVALPLGGVAGALTSCEDMMTVETGDKAYVNAQDTLYSYLGIMRCMQDVAERQVILGEIRGDLVSSTDYTTDTLYAISNFDNPKDQTCSMLQVSDYYNVINNCNFYIQNADTNAIKSNIKYMIPEYAQVKAIRAWAYLQLVKNYGAVPFITKPVSSLDVIKNFDYQNNLVDKNNLVDRLIEDGLTAFVDTKYPQYGSTSSTYGSWNNGYTDISSRMCYIPIRVVLGDLYLLRGASKGDYEQAAKYYYTYLKNETLPLYRQYCTAMTDRTGSLTYNKANNWGTWASQYSYTATTNEVITIIPSSANAGLGKMLTRVADIFGYTPSSSQYSSETQGSDGAQVDANGSTQYEAAGAISVTRNRKRQFCPSNSYIAHNEVHDYINYLSNNPSDAAGELRYSIIEDCDARYGNSVEDYSYEGIGYPLCAKAAKGAQFFYSIPIYRKTLIWLRLAEAINRAGHPEFAFAILKDGLNQYTIPTVQDFTKILPHTETINGTDYYLTRNTDLDITVYNMVDADPEATTKEYFYYDAEGNFTVYEEKVGGIKWKEVNDTTYYRDLKYSASGAMHYVTDSLKVQNFNSFLDFSDDIWNTTYGIHAKGAGFGSWSTANQDEIQTNISGLRDEGTYDFEKELLRYGVTLKDASTEEIINAVENIIVDELALETAFEGNRFTDLVRIAEHKNASGIDGTDWLAKKIANRNYRPASFRAPEQGAFDNALYSKLKNTKNWYFELPEWSVK